MSKTPDRPGWIAGIVNARAVPPPSGVNVMTGSAEAVPMFWMTTVADRPIPAAFFDAYGAYSVGPPLTRPLSLYAFGFATPGWSSCVFTTTEIGCNAVTV